MKKPSMFMDQKTVVMKSVILIVNDRFYIISIRFWEFFFFAEINKFILKFI